MEPNRPRSSSQTRSWLGCGCGVLVFLALAAIVGLTWFGYRQGKEMEKNFTDPVAREAKAREILPWRELPAGYHPLGSFSVPFLMDMAMFSDQEPKAGEQEEDRDPAFDESGLFYMKFHPWVSDKPEMLAWLRGETKEAPGWIRRSQAQMDEEQVAHRGTVESGGRTIVYAVARGSGQKNQPDNQPDNQPNTQTDTQPAPPAEGENPTEGAPEGARREGVSPEQEGLMTFFSVDCPDDKRAHMGVWFGPDPDPAKPVTEIDLTGTVGDPARLREMLGHFELCR
jgi:hypothetical protein